ncbi:MAG: hypothetical protein WC375_05400 [Methanomassiliicoccales archaeon]|jgi:hypothetical protein
MNEPIKIYIVKGNSQLVEYDKDVVGVFTDLKLAHTLNNDMLCKHPDDIQVLTLNELPFIEQLKDGLRPYAVELERDGTLKCLERISIESSIGTAWIIAPYSRNYKSYMRIQTWAKNETQALAISQEKYDEFISGGKWREEADYQKDLDDDELGGSSELTSESSDNSAI